MLVEAAPQLLKDAEAAITEQRQKEKALKNPLVITLKNPSVDSIIVSEGPSVTIPEEGPSVVSSEKTQFTAQTGLSPRQQMLQDAELHNRQRFQAKEA